MKKSKRRIVVLAWFLLVSLMPLYVVKALHYHCVERDSAENSCSHNDSSHHSLENCPICHFYLLPFTENSLLRLTVFMSFIAVCVACYQCKWFVENTDSIYLRAPPVL